MLCAWSQGTVLDKSPRVRAAYGTELNAAAPAWAVELTQQVRAATPQPGDRNLRLSQPCVDEGGIHSISKGAVQPAWGVDGQLEWVSMLDQT